MTNTECKRGEPGNAFILVSLFICPQKRKEKITMKFIHVYSVKLELSFMDVTLLRPFIRIFTLVSRVDPAG